MKLGNRVTVKPLPDGHPLRRFSGKRGEVQQIGADGAVPHPDGDAELVLVDGQYVNGVLQGVKDFREWLPPEVLEIG